MSKTIVLTGANGVLGNLTAKTFAAGGYSLALFGRDAAKLNTLAAELNLPAEKVYIRAANLMDANELNSAAQEIESKFGGIYALIHLVGGWTGGKSLPESSEEEFALMLNQHAWTTYHLLKTFAPILAGQTSSRVVIVSHPAASLPVANSALYAAAKSAQEMLVLTLAQEYKGKGLTANILQVKEISTGEKGTPPEAIVSAMNYLLGDAAGQVNGAKIPLY